jgi:uncharacterized protein
MTAPVSATVDFRVRLPEELRPTAQPPREHTERYDAVLNVSATRDRTLAQLHDDMAEAGVDRAVVHAEYEFGDPADELNEAVARLVAGDPDRFAGIGTLSLEPLRIRRSLQQVAQVHELGLVGVNIQPSFFGLPMTDPRLYPAYARCEELGLIVCLHTGVNYTTAYPIANDHPLQLDEVACQFPDLMLVACHAGWPWAADMVAVMRKHPNVYADFGGLAPKYVGEDGTGWSVMRRFLNSLLAGQVLFATDWPVFPIPRAVAEWRAMGLKPETLRRLLGGNADALMAAAGRR